MADSVQEQIIKKIAYYLGTITVANGQNNTIASVQRLEELGVNLSIVPTILVKEGDCTVDLAESVAPHVRRRMEVLAVAITRQDESASSADTRSGGEQLNSLVADMEWILANNRKWDGLAIQTSPPDYLSVELDASTPHLARAVRFEVLYEHLRTDPYSQG